MKVFIAGPRAISDFDNNVIIKLKSIIKNNFTVLVGDATGIDKSVQQFFYNNNYKNVYVYASQGKARNNIGNWSIHNVHVPDNIKGFDFFAAKDLEMANAADFGFMIWNCNSKGTLNNIINLTKQNKRVLIYLTPYKNFYSINNLNAAKKLVSSCGDKTNNLFNELSYPNISTSMNYNLDQVFQIDNKK